MMRVLVSFLALTAVKETTAGEPATAGTRTSVQEDFAVVLTCRAGMEARIAAGRASRTVLLPDYTCTVRVPSEGLQICLNMA